MTPADRPCGPAVPDGYRARVRAMDALDHFATDYLPVRGDQPSGGDGCPCDAEPGLFAVFTFAVLAQHRLRRRRGTAVVMCSCGSPAPACPILTLAGDLLFSPADEPCNGT